MMEHGTFGMAMGLGSFDNDGDVYAIARGDYDDSAATRKK